MLNQKYLYSPADAQKFYCRPDETRNLVDFHSVQMQRATSNRSPYRHSINKSGIFSLIHKVSESPRFESNQETERKHTFDE